MNEQKLISKSLRRERKIRKPKMKVSGRRVKNLAKLILDKAKKTNINLSCFQTIVKIHDSLKSTNNNTYAKRKCITSPSWTMYSFPSRRKRPLSLAPDSPPQEVKSL